MYKYITFCSFCDSFSTERENTFTYDGKLALFNYLERLEEETDTTIELDIIALCCEYTEYENLEELQKDYSDIESIEDLQNNTQVIEIPNSESFIIAQY